MRRLIFLVFTFSTIGFAQWQDIEATEFPMDPPPAVGSLAYQADFTKLHELQDARTSEDCGLAWRQLFPDFASFYQNAESPLTEAERAKVEELSSKLISYVLDVSGYYKEKYMRPRPYKTDPEIRPCIVRPGGSKSYPSSHASVATATACVFAKVFPAKADILRAYGKRLGDLRMNVGVHHPSDVAAGQKLGQAVCDRLLNEADFVAELP